MAGTGEHHPFKSGLPACVHECEKQVGPALGKKLIEKPEPPVHAPLPVPQPKK